MGERDISTNIQDPKAKTPLKPHIEKTFTTISAAKKPCKFSEERMRKYHKQTCEKKNPQGFQKPWLGFQNGKRRNVREREREGACLLTIRVTFVKPFVTKHLLYINGALRRVRPLPITP